MHTYSQFRAGFLPERVSTTKVRTRRSYFVYGSVGGKIKKYVDWGAERSSSTRRDISGGDVSFGANLALTGYIRKRPLILEGRFRMETPFAGLLAGESIL